MGKPGKEGGGRGQHHTTGTDWSDRRPRPSINALIVLSGVLAVIALTPVAVRGGETQTGEASVSNPAIPRTAQAESTYEFQIPEQPLAAALNAFSQVTGWEVGAPAEVTQDVTSPGVSGSYTPEEALHILLAGTQLQYRLTGAKTVILEKRPKTSGEETGLEMQPVVVSTTRTETPVSELTRAVTVVQQDDIDKQKRIDRSVGEILSKTVPGFSPSTEALTNFGQTLRGRNFLTLIDGAPQSTPLRNGRRALNTIEANAIERIEVVRGGTAVYGFGASGGLINIITRKPEPGVFNAQSVGGFTLSTTHPGDSIEWNTNHRVSGGVGQADYLVSGTFVRRNGFFDAEGDRIPPDPFPVQGGLADTDEYNVLGKVGYDFDVGQQRIELMVNRFNILQDTKFGFGTGNPATGQKTPAVRGSVNPSNPGTKNTLANLKYHHEDLFGSKVKTRLYYGDLTTRFAKFPNFPQVEVNSEKLGGRLTVDTPVEVGPVAFNAIWGVDYLHDETAQPAIDGPTNTPEMRQNAIAGFLQLEVPLAEWGLLRTGVRHESIGVDVDDVVNRQDVFVEGGNLDFNKTLFNVSSTVFLTDSMELFGGFSQGFSLADIGRAIADTTATQASALESEVQTVDNYELGLRGRYEHWNASITGFFSKSDNGTTFSPDLVIAKQPERIYGVELTANVEPVERVRFGGTFTWLQGEVDLDDDGDFEEDLPSTRIPPEKLTVYTEYSPFDWWSTRLQGIYSGDRSPDSTQFGGGKVTDYTVVDFYSSFRIGRNRLEVGVENLLNKDYFPVLNQAGGRSFSFSKGPGRTVSFTYTIDF